MCAHDISPRCAGDSQLCAYMEREWNASPAYLGDGDGGDGTRHVEDGPAGPLARVLRSSRSRVRQPHL